MRSAAAVDELWTGGNPITDMSPLLSMPVLAGVDLTGLDSAQLAGIDALPEDGVCVGGLA